MAQGLKRISTRSLFASAPSPWAAANLPAAAETFADCYLNKRIVTFCAQQFEGLRNTFFVFKIVFLLPLDRLSRYSGHQLSSRPARLHPMTNFLGQNGHISSSKTKKKYFKCIATWPIEHTLGLSFCYFFATFAGICAGNIVRRDRRICGIRW